MAWYQSEEGLNVPEPLVIYFDADFGNVACIRSCLAEFVYCLALVFYLRFTV